MNPDRPNVKVVESRAFSNGLRVRRYTDGTRTVEVPEHHPASAGLLPKAYAKRANEAQRALLDQQLTAGHAPQAIATALGVSLGCVYRRRRALHNASASRGAASLAANPFNLGRT